MAKFKVGDRVMITGEDAYSTGCLKNSIATVVAVFPNPGEYEIVFDAGSFEEEICPLGRWYMSEEYMLPLKDADCSSPEYIALQNSVNRVLEFIGLDPDNLPDGSLSDVIIQSIIDDRNNLRYDLDIYKAMWEEFMDKTEFVQEAIRSGDLSVHYLGWHRADICKDLLRRCKVIS